MAAEKSGITGTVTVELRGKDGKVKSSEVIHNLVTQVGDQMYGENGAGISGAPATPTGMKLGTDTTAEAPSKTGTGAALVTYLSGSDKAFDSGFPTSALNSSSRRITYKRTYAAGEATSASAITEAVIVNDTLADSTSSAANTVARVQITGVASKGADDTLTITWTHDLLGA